MPPPIVGWVLILAVLYGDVLDERMDAFSSFERCEQARHEEQHDTQVYWMSACLEGTPNSIRRTRFLGPAI